MWVWAMPNLSAPDRARKMMQKSTAGEDELTRGATTALKGLAKVKKTLADGRTTYYCYAWRGGPLLKAEDRRPRSPSNSSE
jgi:hypothetical protein